MDGTLGQSDEKAEKGDGTWGKSDETAENEDGAWWGKSAETADEKRHRYGKSAETAAYEQWYGSSSGSGEVGKDWWSWNRRTEKTGQGRLPCTPPDGACSKLTTQVPGGASTLASPHTGQSILSVACIFV